MRFITRFLVFLVLPAVALVGCSDDDDAGPGPGNQMTYQFRIENKSGTLIAPESGEKQAAVPFAPGVWAVANQDRILFQLGARDDGDGLEALAEDGVPTALYNSLQAEGITSSGVFDTPEGSDSPGPIGPGEAYEFTFQAEPGDYLTFATMYVQSNDLFVAPDEMGIRLFDDDGNPMAGDVTDQLYLLDAGTEINEEPGVGPNQAPRQPAPDTGPTEGVVQEVDDGWSYPATEEVVMVGIASDPIGEGAVFTVTIGVETESSTPLAPGVWAIHESSDPLFTSGQPDRGLGLEALAEDGSPAQLGPALETMAEIAASGVFNTPVGAGEPGPAGPGQAYEFTFEAEEGMRLSFATMYVQSNDLFYAPSGEGIALFDGQGDPISGDITGEILLYDAGTELNEEPGVGPNQAPRQSGPDTGPTEGVVQPVQDGFEYEEVDELIEATLTLQ
ncbi:MAG: hypothetical protein GF355_03970 [Candidatus Eisenbacteria bacterium]|nr:hypothetical protein [Candidatus Eisenbacteria bacterium]